MQLLFYLALLHKETFDAWLYQRCMATKQPEKELQYEDFFHLTVSLLKDFLAQQG